MKVLYVESPVRIFVREVGLEEKYLQMQNVLTKVSAASASSAICGEIRVNSSVICYMAASARWERGLVMSVESHSGTLTVRLADIGKIMSIPRSEVRLMGSELESFGNLTKCVALTDIEPAGALGHGWSKESTFVLRDLLEKEMVLMKRLGGKEVQLFFEKKTISGPMEPTRKSLISVAKFLINKGLAFKKGTIERCLNIGGIERDPQFVGAESQAESELKMITRKSLALASQDEVGELEAEAEGEHEEEEEEDDSDSDSVSYLSSSLSPPSSPSQIQRLPAEPVVPSSRVFRARLTNIDKKGTVWVVPKDTSRLEEEVRSLIQVSTSSCPRYDGRVGDVVVVRKNMCRGRIIGDNGETVTLLDIDSGKKYTVDWSLLTFPTKSLLDRPPLAIPLKIYGIKKRQTELTADVRDLHSEEVMVINLALKQQRFPLPANVRFAKNNNSVDGNLGLDLLEKGFFQLIKNREDWTREFLDHGLDKELDPKEKFVKESDGQANYWSIVTEGPKPIDLLNMKCLPHPVPLSEGQWLSVQVEEIMKDLKDGVETMQASQVWCSLLSIPAPTPAGQQAEAASILNAGLKTLQTEFEDFEEDLMLGVISAGYLEKVSIGQEVLAYQDDEAWSRAVINHVKKDGSLVVTYTDYGYRMDVPRDNIRAITQEQLMEPSHVRDFYFKMPGGNQELREIRHALGGATLARVEEIKISEEGEQVHVSFWEKKDEGDLAQIC